MSLRKAFAKSEIVKLVENVDEFSQGDDEVIGRFKETSDVTIHIKELVFSYEVCVRYEGVEIGRGYINCDLISETYGHTLIHKRDEMENQYVKRRDVGLGIVDKLLKAD